MTDHTSSLDHRRHSRAPVAEFRLYFGVIFVAALPFETVGWLADAVGGRRAGGAGPVGRALATARIITPAIFSA
ncbi:MAG: protein pufQ [Paracoccaceae bacterium]|nr:protein pufQ [Paracoccaceae bacterium]